MAKKKSRQNRRRRWLLILPYLLVLLLFCFAFGQRFITATKVCDEIRREEAVLTAVKKERDALLAQKEHLNDDAYLELLAREKLRYIYPGEKIWLQASVNDEVLPSAEVDGMIGE